MPAPGAAAAGGGGRQTLMFSATFPKEIQKRVRVHDAVRCARSAIRRNYADGHPHHHRYIFVAVGRVGSTRSAPKT